MTPGTGTRHGTNSGIGGTGTRPGIGIWNGTRTWIPGSQSASTVDSIPFPQVDLYDVTTSPENKVRWRRHSSGGSDEEEEEEEGEEGGEEEDTARIEPEDKLDENLVLNISSTASISTNTTSSSVYGSMLHR
jgi:hypothetical protein